LKQTFLATKKFGGYKNFETLPLNAPIATGLAKVPYKFQQACRLLNVEIVLEHIFYSDL